MTAEETLASWNRQLEAVRANMLLGGGKRGFSAPSMIAIKSGLEFLQAWLAGDGLPPFGDPGEMLIEWVG